MKRIVIIVLINLSFLSNNVYSEETFIVCDSKSSSSSVTLSFNNKMAKEYVGASESIKFKDIEITKQSLIFQSVYDNFFRLWNIDRYSGLGTLTWKSKNQYKSSEWICNTASKKF